MGYIAWGKASSSYVLSSDNLSPSTYSIASENSRMFVILCKALNFYYVTLTMLPKLLRVMVDGIKSSGIMGLYLNQDTFPIIKLDQLWDRFLWYWYAS